MKDQKKLLNLLIIILVFVVLWTAFSIYHSFITSTISEHTNIQTTAIDPTFNLAIIEKLKDRAKVQPSFESNITIDRTATPSVSITPRPTVRPTSTPRTPTPTTLP